MTPPHDPIALTPIDRWNRRNRCNQPIIGVNKSYSTKLLLLQRLSDEADREGV